MDFKQQLKMDKKIIKDYLEVLFNSCVEGQTGEWDCSTQEGKEGFQDMATIIERVAGELEIELENLKEFKEAE